MIQKLLTNRLFVIIALVLLVGGVTYGAFLLFHNTGDLNEKARGIYAAQRAANRAKKPAPRRGPTTTSTAILTPAATPLPSSGSILPAADTKPATNDNDLNVAPPNPKFAKEKAAVEDVPGVVAASAEHEKPSTAISPDLPPVVLPPVPDSLVNQRLPEMTSGTVTSPTVTTIEIDPQRYLFNNQSPQATAGAAIVKLGETNVPDVSIRNFAPRGEWIEVALMHNATSNPNGDIDVMAAVWEPFYFQGRKLLDVGDKLLGTATKGKFRDRLLVKFDMVVFKDGRSMKIDAVAQDTDGTLGIRGFMVGDRLLQSMSSILLDAAAGFTNTFKDRLTNNTMNYTGSSITTTTSELETQDAKNGGINAGQKALETVAALVAQDIQDNAPYLLVLAGTRCRAYLKASIDTSTREYSK